MEPQFKAINCSNGDRNKRDTSLSGVFGACSTQTPRVDKGETGCPSAPRKAKRKSESGDPVLHERKRMVSITELKYTTLLESIIRVRRNLGRIEGFLRKELDIYDEEQGTLGDNEN